MSWHCNFLACLARANGQAELGSRPGVWAGFKQENGRLMTEKEAEQGETGLHQAMHLVQNR